MGQQLEVARSMFSKVIVGFDGSEQARDALSLAVALTARDGELVVCCVHHFKTLSAHLDPAEPHLDHAAAERCAEEALELLDSPLAVSPLLVASPSAAGVLQRTAEQQHADLLVLGSSHRGAVGRVLVGSVTEETLYGSPCPVAVAPVGFHSQSGGPHLARIAVGYDVAAPSQDALEAGVALASQAGAELRVVAVADTAAALAGGASLAMSYPAIVKARLDAAEEDVAQALAGLGEGISASSEVRDGMAAEKLLEITHSVDLLVLGSRGRSPVRRLVLGSVCDAVVRAAACPVLVIPPAVEAEGPPQRETDPLAGA
jgi:nucleotide-binding universal stress UspA family protein